MQPLDPFTMPLEGRRLIEASAGTGKTWTLTLLILRLIIEQGLGIEQILVLTYTRAATAELRSRIRSRLREAQQQLDGMSAKEDPALTTVLGAVDPATASLRLNQALARMDEAAITTIHGFCQKVIKEHAFEAGFAFDQEIISDESELQAEVMSDFWRTRFYPLGPEESELVAHHWPTPQDMLAAIRSTLMIDEDCVLPHLPGDALKREIASVQASHGRLVQAWQEHKDEAEAQLANDPCLSRSEQYYRMDQVDELLVQLQELLTNASFPRLLPNKLERLCAAQMLEKRLSKKACADWQPHAFFTIFAQFWNDYQHMLNLWRITWLQQAHRSLKDDLRRRKQEQRLLSYDDLLSQVDMALQGPGSGQKLARTLRNRYRAVLVDEFQDTDPVQYRIFSTICAESGHPLYMIGDPKQAIYSFRGGDIFTYMQAKQETPFEQCYTMASNHRSAPGMIAAVNALFQGRPKAFVFDEAIPFHPVEPGGRVQDGEFLLHGTTPSPLNVLLLSGQEDKALSKENADQRAAQACAAAIKELLRMAAQGEASIQGRTLASGDIAILVRSHSQAELMRGALGKLGLASVYASKMSVFSSPEAAELATLLQALLNPASRSLCSEALATSFFGFNASQLYQVQQDSGLWEKRVQQLRTAHNHWQRQGVMAMLHRLFQQEGITARLTAQPEGERRLTNLLHLSELLHEEERQRPGMERLLRWLTRQRQEADSDSDETRLMRLESDEALIRISTQHTAKGLEYPVVFLPFPWRSPGNAQGKDAALAFHERETNRACRDFDLNNEKHKELAAEEEKAEEMRLLYVALTRARYCTCICWGRVSDMMNTPMARLLHPKDVSKDETQLRRDLEQLNADQSPPLLRAFPPGKLPWQASETENEDAARSASLLAARSFQGSVPHGYTSCSYSSLSTGQELHPVLEESVDNPASATSLARFLPEDYQHIATFPRGTRAGLCLHAMLEELDFTLPLAEQGAVVQKQLEHYGFEARWQPALQTWLDRVLATPLPGSRALAGLAPADQLRELNFLFPVQGLSIAEINQLFTRFHLARLPGQGEVSRGLMKGFVDLIFRHAGRYFIVDYKSNHLGHEPGSYTSTALAASMVQHHYHLQYLLYTLALHRHLQTRLPGYDYERHFGGVYYLFLRGMEAGSESSSQGIYQVRPEFALIEALDSLCRGAEVQHAAA